MKYSTLLAFESNSELQEVRSAIEGEFEIAGYAENAMELLMKCKNLRPDILILDLRLPLLDGIKMICYLQQQEWIKCVIIVDDQKKSLFSKNDLHDIDGIIMRPLTRNNILPCTMMAIARSEKKLEVLREYEEMEETFRKDRALEYTKQMLRNCYGISDDEALKMIKKSALENGESYTVLAEMMFDINCSDRENGGKKDGRTKYEVRRNRGR